VHDDANNLPARTTRFIDARLGADREWVNVEFLRGVFALREAIVKSEIRIPLS
jgi:hypothetical protein